MQKLLIFLSLFLFTACGNYTNNILTNKQIDSLIESGNYKQAESIIKLKIAIADSLSVLDIEKLKFKLDIMDRIRRDFTKDDSTVIAYIKQHYPAVTEQELAAWEASGALECKIIDGVKKYFYNAPSNLFRIDKDAQKHWSDINGRQSDSLDRFLGKYIPQVTQQINKIGNHEHLVMPVNMKIKYKITVKPNEVPAGEMIRVWMPYPREATQHKNIKLLSTSQPEYIISPNSYAHKSIYMESPSIKDSAITFSYELSYTSYNHRFDFNSADILPYNKDSELYKKHTEQREDHIIFTNDIKRLTDSIVGTEQNPYLKAVKIFDYIVQNYPWASAREYSTIKNIPQYVIDNKHGDCGQQSLLFITMARYAGIPAKWQSGWMMHPGEVNLHDWAEAYFEGIGWVPIDQSFGYVYQAGLTKEEAITKENVYHYFTKGLDAYRYIVNDDFSGNFYPAKTHPRSETVDFQRGEVEWRGENLYFGRWKYKMIVEYE